MQVAGSRIMETKTKEQLRAEILEKRNSLSKEERNEKSKIIAEQFLGSGDFKNAGVIFAYVSYNSEVGTHGIIKKALGLGKKIAVPRIDFENRTMLPYLINDFERGLKPNKLGILEPLDATVPFNAEEIDIVLVPAAVFDLTGHKIGSGKGYYDKFLGKIHSNAKLIGLAYETQVIDKIPVDVHDMPVQKIITEKRIIDCKQGGA